MNLLRIKWENITSFIVALYIIIVDTKIFINEGFEFGIFGLELMATICLVLTNYILVRTTRKSLLEL